MYACPYEQVYGVCSICMCTVFELVISECVQNDLIGFPIYSKLTFLLSWNLRVQVV